MMRFPGPRTRERGLEQRPCSGGAGALQRWRAFVNGLKGRAGCAGSVPIYNRVAALGSEGNDWRLFFVANARY